MIMTRSNQQNQLFSLFQQVIEGKTTRGELYSYTEKTHQKDLLNVFCGLLEAGIIDCVVYEDGRTTRWFLRTV